MDYHCTSTRGRENLLKNPFRRLIKVHRRLLAAAISIIVLALLAGCDERRRSDAELGLNPQQAAGRRLYDNYCDRCHAPYSSRGRQGPPMKGLFKRQYMPLSGMPSNDDRVSDIIRMGRNKMPAYSEVMNQQQIGDLLAYMHTL